MLSSKAAKLFTNAMSQKSHKNEQTHKKEESPLSLNKSNNVVISVLAKPNAKQNAITNFSAEGVGVQINSPASEGEANAQLVKFMASVLGLKKSDIIFDKGFKSRNKRLIISADMTLDDVKDKIVKEIQNS